MDVANAVLRADRREDLHSSAGGNLAEQTWDRVVRPDIDTIADRDYIFLVDSNWNCVDTYHTAVLMHSASCLDCSKDAFVVVSTENDFAAEIEVHSDLRTKVVEEASGSY